MEHSSTFSSASLIFAGRQNGSSGMKLAETKGLPHVAPKHFKALEVQLRV